MLKYKGKTMVCPTYNANFVYTGSFRVDQKLFTLSVSVHLRSTPVVMCSGVRVGQRFVFLCRIL